MMGAFENLKNARNQIIKGRLEGAMHEIRISLEITFSDMNKKVWKNLNSDLDAFSAQFHHFKNQSLGNLTTDSFSSIQFSKVSHGLLNLIGEMEEILRHELNLSQQENQKQFNTISKNLDGKLADVVLVVQRDFQKYSTEDQQKLFSAIGNLIQLGIGDITIKSVEPGSVKFTISLPYSKAMELEKLIKDGELLDHDVIYGEVLSNAVKKISNINSPKAKIKVGLVESDLDYLTSILEVINQQPDIVCISSYSTNAEALNKIPKTPPDIIVIDPKVGKGTKINLMAELKERIPQTLILVLSNSDNDQDILAALKAGASGYLLKTTMMEDIIEAIREINSGGAPMSPVIANKVTSFFFDSPSSESFEIEPLSPQENRILVLLTKGATFKEIEKELGVPIGGVKLHIHKIYQKLQVKNKTEAISKYLNSRS